MIQIKAMLIKVIINQIAKQFKLKKILSYVEKPNDADLKIKDLQNDIYDLKKEIKDLRDLSHPPIFTKDDHKKLIKEIKDLKKKLK